MSKLLDNLPITIVVMLISVATSYGVIQAKTNSLEKSVEKAQNTVDELRDFRAAQTVENTNIKEKLDETKSDLKEILKVLRNKNGR